MQHVLATLDGPARIYDVDVRYKPLQHQLPYRGSLIVCDLRRTDDLLWQQVLDLHGATAKDEAGFNWQPSKDTPLVLHKHESLALIYEADQKIPGLTGRIRTHPIDGSLREDGDREVLTTSEPALDAGKPSGGLDWIRTRPRVCCGATMQRVYA